jgi:methylmalonyl-CoA mutase C-terminal domain/subunit
VKAIKVIIAKAGLDGHERGAHAVTAMLRDAGMEVTYLGMFQSPEQIVSVAADEDADVIGLSSLNGAHLTFSAKVLAAMREARLDNVLLLVGGIIPAEDVDRLSSLGVHGIFPAATLMDEIVSFIQANARPERVIGPA